MTTATISNGIRLTGVNKGYKIGKDQVTIFDNLDLDIPQGDFVAVMGPSGSGKSTLLNMIGGIDRPDSGEITCGFSRLDTMREGAIGRWRAQNVGYVFQFYNLMPMLTAAQNVELPLLLTKLTAKQRKERVQTVMNLVGLAARQKHLPSELSGGQMQRVGIARALAVDPNILLCDEPTGDLDRKSADDILEMLRVLNKEFGKTIIMVTHDDNACRFAKRTLRLDKGKFIQDKIDTTKAA